MDGDMNTDKKHFGDQLLQTIGNNLFSSDAQSGLVRRQAGIYAPTLRYSEE